MHIKSALTDSFSKLAATVAGLGAIAVLTMLSLSPAKADNPTFFLSNSAGCSSAVTSLDVSQGSNTLYVCIDAENEGEGLLGAEAHISYSASSVNVSNVVCDVFDTCIDLSEPGTIKLLAASGPLPDGTPATAQEALGSFSADFTTVGSTSFSFTLSQIINDQEDLESRSALGLTVNVSEATEEPAPEEQMPPAEEVPVEEEAMPPEEQMPPEETQPPVEEEPVVNEEIGVSGVVITPLAGVALPGSQVQIISRADYYGGRDSENITSCFPCPTPDNDADGTTSYHVVNGPASFAGSKVVINGGATPGQVITINADYHDNVSNTGGQSANQYITIVSELPAPPPQEEVTPPVEEAAPPQEEPAPEAAVGGEGEGEGESQQAQEDAQKSLDEAVQAKQDASDKMGEEPTQEDQDAYDQGSQLLDQAQGAYDEGNYEEAKSLADQAKEQFGKIGQQEAPAQEAPAPTEGEVHPAAEDYQGLAEAALTEMEPQQNSDVVIPTKPVVDTCASFSQTQDGDGDGLSDRTECYLGTDAQNPDSDGDSCWDGDEINRFYSNPLTVGDCNLRQVIEEKVLIVDPKPDWIVKRFDISGTAPSRSQRVGITAFPAIHGSLNPVVGSLDELLSLLQETAPNEEEFQTLEEKVTGQLDSLSAFLDTYGGDYAGLSASVGNASDLVSQPLEELTGNLDELEAVRDELNNVQTQPVFLGEISDLLEVGAGDNVAAGFHMEDAELVSDGVYDLIATAFLDDGTTLSSAPVRVTLDSAVSVPDPSPEALDGISLAGLSGPVEVKNGRPVLSGQSSYGVQLFATWESLVLASSIIADSSEGGFDIQAPRELASGESHKVSLYAVHKQPAGLVRSNSVTVDFTVGAPAANYTYLIYILGVILLILILAALVAKRRMVRIDHLPPEHRAKENELYEAFGLDKERGEGMPADHKEKEKEMEQSFGSLNVDVAPVSEEKAEAPAENVLAQAAETAATAPAAEAPTPTEEPVQQPAPTAEPEANAEVKPAVQLDEMTLEDEDHEV